MNRWIRKFQCAFRGIGVAMQGQSSFAVHVSIGFAVIAAGWYLSITSAQWCAIVLCISIVLAMETMNTALEKLVKHLSPDHDPRIGDVLDMASGAVLIVSIGAACVGMIVFLVF